MHLMRLFHLNRCLIRKRGNQNNLINRDILLPHHSEDVRQIALDIGGSLAKIVWFSKRPGISGGRLNFMKFETGKIEECIDFIRNVLYQSHHADIPPAHRIIIATGGGAHKYHQLIKDRLGVDLQKQDEMEWYAFFMIDGSIV